MCAWASHLRLSALHGHSSVRQRTDNARCRAHSDLKSSTVVFGDVAVWVDRDYQLNMHIDTYEATIAAIPDGVGNTTHGKPARTG